MDITAVDTVSVVLREWLNYSTVYYYAVSGNHCESAKSLAKCVIASDYQLYFQSMSGFINNSRFLCFCLGHCLFLLSCTFDWCLATVSVQPKYMHVCFIMHHTGGFVLIAWQQIHSGNNRASCIHFHNHYTDCSLTEVWNLRAADATFHLIEEGKLRQILLVPRLIHHMYHVCFTKWTANHHLPVLYKE